MVVTFVFDSNPKSVHFLDKKRLNKQRVEAKQILDTLEGKSNGWSNHPAVKMWQGHEKALQVYINHCIRAWKHIGGQCQLEIVKVEGEVIWPWWYTWECFHLAHKCSLLRKNPDYYGKIFVLTTKESKWLEYGYIWPSKILPNTMETNPLLICDPIGKGAPSHYRWSVSEVEKWSKNPYINPKTGRAIKSTSKGSIYFELKQAHAYYKNSGLLQES